MIKIFPFEFRGQTLFAVFSHGMVRRKRGRRFVWMTGGDCKMIDCTAEEVGQLMGGN